MRRRQRGNMVLEAALWLPAITMLVVFIIQFGKITYIYYSLRNTVYTAAQYLSVQQGTNFCNLTGDANIQAALEFAVTGTTDGSAPSFISNLTTSMLTVNIACVDPASGATGPCDTSGCGGLGSGPRPDYVVVSVSPGYSVTPRMLFLSLDAILLTPSVTVPFGGTAL